MAYFLARCTTSACWAFSLGSPRPSTPLEEEVVEEYEVNEEEVPYPASLLAPAPYTSLSTSFWAAMGVWGRVPHALP